MSNLGIGVMLRTLGGNKESAEAFGGAIGKEIAALEIRDGEGWGATNALYITFTDGNAIKLYDDGQSCCESRYMHTDDKLDDFVGATLLDAEVRDGGEEPAEYGDVKESQFLVITTSIGQFTVVNYNEHNGYYGGFAIVAKWVD